MRHVIILRQNRLHHLIPRDRFTIAIVPNPSLSPQSHTFGQLQDPIFK